MFCYNKTSSPKLIVGTWPNRLPAILLKFFQIFSKFFFLVFRFISYHFTVLSVFFSNSLCFSSNLTLLLMCSFMCSTSIYWLISMWEILFTAWNGFQVTEVSSRSTDIALVTSIWMCVKTQVLIFLTEE